MFGLWTPGVRAGENFYRNFFALLCFAVFALAVAMNSPIAFLVTLCFGTLSRTAVKKGWRNPAIVERFSILVRKPQASPFEE